MTTLALAVAALAALLPQNPLEVEITPKDGAAMAASWKAARLAIDTAFGAATVDPDKLEQIVFGDPDLVVAAGVELRGKLKLPRFDAQVDGKNRRFTSDTLLSIVVLRDGMAMGAPSFGGQWMTSFGPMQLEQRGLKVSGTYGFGGSGKIEGGLDKGELVFAYSDGDSSGQGRLKLLADDDAFTGSYGDDGFWGGYRRRAAVAKAAPGEVASGQTECGMRYHVRLPKAHKDGSKWPAVCILHGSNMDSRAYVDTIVSAWPALAEEYAIVGLDGERLSSASKPGALRFNYTYVNFSGPKVGPEWVHRQSPALVAESLTELGKTLPLDKWYLGGHSQGGFLTYCLVMFYPELLAGAFPMSCNLLVQCEPDNFEVQRQLQQHEVAVAVMHGQADTVVDYSGGAYCYLRLVDSGFPRLRLFDPERVAHQFALLPVDEAVRWLAAMRAEDPVARLECAETRAEANAWRDVGALLADLENDRLPATAEGRRSALQRRLESAASAAAGELEQAIAADKRGEGKWIEDFLAFRREFATAAAADKVLGAYAKLRQAQAAEGDRLFERSRQASSKGDRLAIYQEIRAKCYATKWYEAVKLWSK